MSFFAFFFFFWGGGCWCEIPPSRKLKIFDQTAHFERSDLDLNCAQKVLKMRFIAKGFKEKIIGLSTSKHILFDMLYPAGQVNY